MKKSMVVLLAGLTIAMAAVDADAARRFGGGGNIGKQRPPTTTQREATPSPAAPATSPSTAGPTSAAPSAAPAPIAPAPKPSFMSRWGGVLAGLGIGALLASLFGAQMGPIVGMLLLGLVLVMGLVVLMRLFSGRRPEPQPVAGGSATFSGIGSKLGDGGGPVPGPSPARPSPVPAVPPGFDTAAFERVGKTSFMRLQEANDRGDLDDIRDFTTPQMYAEIAMQLKERGREPQKTEVVSLEARVVEAVVEADYEIASVRFWGLIREAPGASPVPFDETWHVQKKAGDPKSPWLVAGIQQND